VCGRFTSSQRREAVGERFQVAVPETYQERFNLAPQQRALIVLERDNGREAVMAKWGLLPHWGALPERLVSPSAHLTRPAPPNHLVGCIAAASLHHAAARGGTHELDRGTCDWRSRVACATANADAASDRQSP
jgi:hypothetical protein